MFSATCQATDISHITPVIKAYNLSCQEVHIFLVPLAIKQL